MKILICCDSFKDSLSSGEISTVLRQNLLKKFPKAQINAIYVADGGEGSLDSLKQGMDVITHEGQDARFNAISTKYLVSKDGQRAIIELAQTCGLTLLVPNQRNCFETSTYGLGLQIKEAIKNGVNAIDILIGGSATNDLGLGMAAALSHRIYKKNILIEKPVGRDMPEVTSIELDQSLIGNVDFKVVCDVKNSLLGQYGATYTYGSQKGANKAELSILEKGAQHIVQQSQEVKSNNYHLQDGAGAAGGVGWGAMFFLNADFISGMEYMNERLGIEELVRSSDLVITGEGKLDKQTTQGKLVSGIAAMADNANKNAIAICAINELSNHEVSSMGLHKVYPLYDSAPKTISKEDTLTRFLKVSERIVEDQIAV